jgi:fatty-acyl-CoA synthase
MPSVWSEAPRRGAVARAQVSSIADVREIEHTPFLELLPSWSILGMIEHAAAGTPGKSAMVVLDKDEPTRAGRRLTYAELAATIRATANRLREVSGTSRPVVSILTPLLAESFIASWAGAAAGLANPINPFLRVEHVANIMNAAGTTVLVCGTASHGPGAWNEVGKLRAMVPTLREIWCVDHARGNDFFRQQIDTAACDRLTFERSDDPDRTAALLHTGGTTAAPKLVRLTERGMLLNAWCCGTWNGNRSADVVAIGMPYFHVGGAICLALASIVFGQTMIIVSPDGYRDSSVIASFWDLVEAHGVTLTGSAPTTAAAIVASCNDKRPPRGFRFWAGGATVPIQVAREFGEKFGIPLREGWGMTELQGGLIINPSAVAPRIGSIGIPFPYHRARCVPLGSRTAEDSEPGALGILAISGPCVTPGYLDSMRTTELFFDWQSSGERWLNTGDLCTVDTDGYVWHRGRSKDLIIRGAHNIDPLVIEAALLEHPAVLYAAAIGEPDLHKGEIPVAYVQLRPGMPVSESELMDHCRCQITERAGIPRTVRIIDAMPLTAVGKIFKPDLRVDVIRHCVRNVASRLDKDGTLDVEVRETCGSIAVVLAVRDSSKPDAVENMRRELERYTFRVEVETYQGDNTR